MPRQCVGMALAFFTPPGRLLPRSSPLHQRCRPYTHRTPITLKSRRQQSTHQLPLIYIVIHRGLGSFLCSEALSSPIPARVIVKYPGSRCDVRSYKTPLTGVVSGMEQCAPVSMGGHEGDRDVH
jgi:hypothetical protein